MDDLHGTDPLRRLFQAATTGMKVLHLVDPDDPETWTYLHCNQAAAQALGLTVEAVVGARLLELFPAVRGTVVVDHYRRCLREGVTVPFGETSYTHTDGRTDWFRSHIVPLGGHHVGAVFQNINAEVESRQALARTHQELESRVAERTRDAREARLRLQAIVDSAPDLILEIERDGTIGQGARLSAVGVRTLKDLIGAENDEPLQAAIEEALETGRSQLTVQHQTNGHQVLDVRLAPVRAESPTARLVAVVRDITQLHRLERARQLQDRMASLGTLAAGVGHEINNPLQYMGINLDRLRHRLPAQDTELHEVLEEIQFGVERIREVVDELQRFVRGRPGARPQLVDASSVVDRTLRLARHRMGKASTLERTYADAPPIRVHAADLSQAVLNLLVNAADAIEGTTNGVIRVMIRHSEGTVAIGVADNGPGMEAATAARVFDPFWSDKSHGTGLGLGISKELIERNGGTLTVETEPGAGATFWIRLPVGERDEREPGPSLQDSSKPPVAIRQASDGPDAATKPSLLVIDDEALLCKALEATLLDFEVVTRTTLEGARQALAERAFDLVLCDLYLGPDRGDAFWHEIRESAPEQAARFVLMSGTVSAILDEVEVPAIDKRFEVAQLSAYLTEHLAHIAEDHQQSG